MRTYHNGELMQVSVHWIPGENETQAVDNLLKLLRIDYQYSFLGASGPALPSDPTDYMLFHEDYK